MRLPDVLEGILTVPLLFLLARRRFGEVAAAAAALLLALSPLHLRHSQDCTGYAAIPILVLLSFAALDRAYERGRRGDFVVYAARR